MASNPGQLAGAAAGLSELRDRLLFVLMALLVYRAGTHIPVPGINPERLAALFEQQIGQPIAGHRGCGRCRIGTDDLAIPAPRLVEVFGPVLGVTWVLVKRVVVTRQVDEIVTNEVDNAW